MASFIPVHTVSITRGTETIKCYFRTSNTYEGLTVETGIVRVDEANTKTYPLVQVKELVRARILDRVIVEYTSGTGATAKTRRLEMFVAQGKDASTLEDKDVKLYKPGNVTVSGKILRVISKTTQSNR